MSTDDPQFEETVADVVAFTPGFRHIGPDPI